MKSLTTALILALALGACGGPSDEDILTPEKIEASRSAPELPDVALSEDPDPPPAPAPRPDPLEEINALGLDDSDSDLESELPAEAEGEVIPAAFHGRWAMSVEDCEDPRRPGSSALAISTDWIELPEGEGRLYRTLETAPERFAGIFTYNGDRGRWSATEELVLGAGGNVLVRQVEGGRLRYRRCFRTRA